MRIGAPTLYMMERQGGGETDRWERKTGVRGVCAAERDPSARCSQLRMSDTLAHTKHLTPVISSLSGPDGYYFR